MAKTSAQNANAGNNENYDAQTGNDKVCLVADSANGDIIILQPDSGLTQTIDLLESRNYVFDFAPSAVKSLVEQDGDLLIEFTNNSRIVLNEFATATTGEQSAKLVTDSGEMVDTVAFIETLAQIGEGNVEEFLTDPRCEIRKVFAADTDTVQEVAMIEPQIVEAAARDLASIEPASGETAEQLAQIEPAAGDTIGVAPGRGYGFQSSFAPSGILPVNAVGPIDPTLLNYNLPNFDDQNLLLNSQPNAVNLNALVVDETDLDNNGTEGDSGRFNVDFGADGPGTFSATGLSSLSFGGSATGGNLTSDGVPVTVSLIGDQYIGAANGTTIFTMTINTDGTYNFNLLGPLDHADITDPNDVITLNFGITATDNDGDNLLGIIPVQIFDDGPQVQDVVVLGVDETVLDDSGTESVSGQINVDFGLDGAGSVSAGSASTFSAGGSVAGGSLTSNGAAVNVAVVGNQYIGTANGQTVFALTINSNGSYVFDLLGPIDHANTGDPDDMINLFFGVTATDGDGDSVDTTITVNVNDDGPEALNDVINMAENQTTANGNVLNNDDAGADGNASVTAVSFGGTTITVPGSIAGQYGTLSLNADGSFSYTANGGNATAVSDQFTYTMVDGDGDSDTAVLRINIAAEDDTPQNIQAENLLVDETDLDDNNSESDSGVVTADFGNDGPGTFSATGAGTFGFGGSAAGGNLTSDGAPVSVSLVGNQYVGSANGQTIFTLTLNSNGNYTFDLLGALDHADVNDSNDAILLNFGVTATDNDGDTQTGNIQVTVLDDGPTAIDTFCSVDESNFGATISVSGQLQSQVTNNSSAPVDFGLDGAGGVVGNNNFAALDAPFGNAISLTSGGQAVSVSWNGSEYVGTAGGQTIFTLDVNNNGSYTYTQFSPLDHPDTGNNNERIVLEFGVTVTDNDGDTVNTTIQADIYDDGPQLLTTQALSVDESDLPPSDSDSGQISADFGADGNGGVYATGANTFGFGGSVAGGNLTSDGVPVTVSLVGGQYVGSAGGQTIFTLSINNSGAYTFDLLGVLDHADPNDPNDIINLFFGVTVEDGDGDTDTGTIQVNVFDDGPTVIDDVPVVGDDTSSVDETSFGNVLITNGQISTDYGDNGAGSLNFTNDFFVCKPNGEMISLTSGGVLVNVNIVGGNYVGTAGGATVFTLNMNNNGNYQFRMFEPIDHFDPNSNNERIDLKFGVQITDSDGDTDAGSITIGVFDDGPQALDTFCIARENNLNTNVSGQLQAAITNNSSAPVDFGADGGSVQANNSFHATYDLYGSQQPITSNGQAVGVSWNGSEYVGTAGGQTVFTLAVRPDGSYTYNQRAELDHDNSTGNVIYLSFGVDVVDGDGDTVSVDIMVDVYDSTSSSNSASSFVAPAATSTDAALASLGKIGSSEPAGENDGQSQNNVVEFADIIAVNAASDVQNSIDTFVSNGADVQTIAANNNETGSAVTSFSLSAESQQDVSLSSMMGQL